MFNQAELFGAYGCAPSDTLPVDSKLVIDAELQTCWQPLSWSLFAVVNKPPFPQTAERVYPEGISGCLGRFECDRRFVLFMIASADVPLDQSEIGGDLPLM